MKPAARRVAADYLQSDYEVGVTRACGLIGISRSSYRYQSCRGDDAPLRTAIRRKAQERKRWGYRRLQVLLQRDGYMDNHKRIYRIYREEGLQVRKRRRLIGNSITETDRKCVVAILSSLRIHPTRSSYVATWFSPTTIRVRPDWEKTSSEQYKKPTKSTIRRMILTNSLKANYPESDAR